MGGRNQVVDMDIPDTQVGADEALEAAEQWFAEQRWRDAVHHLPFRGRSLAFPLPLYSAAFCCLSLPLSLPFTDLSLSFHCFSLPSAVFLCLFHCLSLAFHGLSTAFPLPFLGLITAFPLPFRGLLLSFLGLITAFH